MIDNALTLVSKNDWIPSSSENAYIGKYTVGRFHMTESFIVEYMKLIHGIEIPDSWLNSCFTDISDNDTRKVMYMEGCDMLSKYIMNEIRNAVKSPSVGIKIYRNGKHLTKIKLT